MVKNIRVQFVEMIILSHIDYWAINVSQISLNLNIMQWEWDYKVYGTNGRAF